MTGLRLGGAPVHPMLVHFPIVAWTTALLADGVFLITGQPSAWIVAYWALAAGALTGLAAMVPGWVDFLLLDRTHTALPAVQRHMLYMSTAWGIFLLDLLVRTRVPPETMPVWLAGLSLAGFVLLAIGSHRGARLVYYHGVNVYRDPV
ncbi:DUF2231 domain-containing protein [Nitrosococcus oceani]|uniref:DUF2231 domain-containing protein n=2 Tax=Nitrosococcus oceani TaxID=1229 RepID=Q3J9H7_NITOC|nr:DUF2231 domain-containing protein [Nitrosococcus oceani]ABA58519.1 conserved hypothetical protein [Nitrosococcus oceani ATCC 19707]KFI19043.1 hypothetical protein IB75_10970 [Nitrosococcus oceani C-27]EDZ66920.1 hypothetical protein NOC27_247 [Nitrosococcus oceani AFC27]KFI22288.1 hypothetical protein HW44_10450 [Nitrosococcus oceani]GEM19639.1 hypothetical protein NONS58_10320 [Nitrosococcus oceani]